jgi:hypothetical protein
MAKEHGKEVPEGYLTGPEVIRRLGLKARDEKGRRLRVLWAQRGWLVGELHWGCRIYPIAEFERFAAIYRPGVQGGQGTVWRDLIYWDDIAWLMEYQRRHNLPHWRMAQHIGIIPDHWGRTARRYRGITRRTGELIRAARQRLELEEAERNERRDRRERAARRAAIVAARIGGDRGGAGLSGQLLAAIARAG